MGWWHLINTRVPKITFSECSSVRKGGGGGKNIDKIGSRAIFSTRISFFFFCHFSSLVFSHKIH